jgi:hypothetical protein
MNGFRGSLLIAFDMYAVKICTDDSPKILSLIYSPHCFGMNTYNTPGRWCLWVLKEEGQKWIHNSENLTMRRLNKSKTKKINNKLL